MTSPNRVLRWPMELTSRRETAAALPPKLRGQKPAYGGSADAPADHRGAPARTGAARHARLCPTGYGKTTALVSALAASAPAGRLAVAGRRRRRPRYLPAAPGHRGSLAVRGRLPRPRSGSCSSRPSRRSGSSGARWPTIWRRCPRPWSWPSTTITGWARGPTSTPCSVRCCGGRRPRCTWRSPAARRRRCRWPACAPPGSWPRSTSPACASPLMRRTLFWSAPWARGGHGRRRRASTRAWTAGR